MLVLDPGAFTPTVEAFEDELLPVLPPLVRPERTFPPAAPLGSTRELTLPLANMLVPPVPPAGAPLEAGGNMLVRGGGMEGPRTLANRPPAGP